MSKHNRATRIVRTPQQQRRQVAVTQDADLVRDLMLRLWAALPPGSTPAGGEKLGKVGKRSASPANLNLDAHDQLVLIVAGVADLAEQARKHLGDSGSTDMVAFNRNVEARIAAGIAFLGPHSTPQRADNLRRDATHETWSAAYLAQWSAAQKPRSNEDFRHAYTQLRLLPGLVDRLHGHDDGEPLAQRIEQDLARWVRDGRSKAGVNRPTIRLGECQLVYDDIRPCGDWDGHTWRPGMLIAYLDADRTQKVGSEKDSDVWCTACGTRWTHAEYADLAVALADKEAG